MDTKVKEIIEAEFANSIVTLEQLPGGMFVGSIVWDGFEGSDDVDRQQLIRKVLRERLGAESAQIGILLTYTSTELAVMTAA